MKKILFLPLLFLSTVIMASCKTTTESTSIEPKKGEKITSDTNNSNTEKSDMELTDGLYAKIITNKGDILLKLEHEKAPLTTANFVGLAEGGIENSAKGKGEPYFDGLKFHRVVPNFVIQGGDPLGNGTGGPGYKFEDEFHPDLIHDRKGTLSMANSGPATNGSQFFITHTATPHLDGKHAVFGYVQGEESLKVVDSIAQGDVMEKVEIIRIGESAKAFDAPKVFVTAQEEIIKKREAEIQNKIKAAQKTKEDLEAKMNGAKTLDSGVKYVILKTDDSVVPSKEGEKVNVLYAGFLTNGIFFDSNREEIAKEQGVYDARRAAGGGYKAFPMEVSRKAQLIPGFIEALYTLKKGERGLFLIPSDKGYGSRGAGNVIPPNSDLYFDIEIEK